MKKKLLIITPHLSTGGAPQVTVNKIKLLKDVYDIKCIEYQCVSNDFVVQRNRIIDLIGIENLITLQPNNEIELFKIIDEFHPNIISMEEFPEIFMNDLISEKLYSKDRFYKIFETTHDSTFLINVKRWLPDKFIFVSIFSAFKCISFNIPFDIIEYPIDYKEKKQLEHQEKLGLDKEWKHILNVGLFTPNKNQKYIYEISQKLKDYKIKFHFIGNQAVNFEFYWNKLINNKTENCIIWGERSDIEDFIHASDLFLFTSTKELNPISIKEALEFNIPILMFNLNTYYGKYNKNKNITFLTGNIDSDCELIINKLFQNK